MRRLLALSLFIAAMSVPVFADPGITVYYHDELLRVTLDGSYVGSYYRVWRSDELVGEYQPISSQYTLCTGDCFIQDQAVLPGKTYYYRFDLDTPGGFVSYGPYPVSVPDTPLGTRVWPNPFKGRAQIQLSAPGSRLHDAPLDAVAKIIDLQGRTVRVIYSGPLARGTTSITWNGQSDAGQQVGAGIYFLRFITPLGTSTTRIARIR